MSEVTNLFASFCPSDIPNKVTQYKKKENTITNNPAIPQNMFFSHWNFELRTTLGWCDGFESPRLLHLIRHPGLVTGNPASWEGDMETPKEKRRFSSGLIPLASRTAVISLDRTSSRSRCSERLFSSHWA